MHHRMKDPSAPTSCARRTLSSELNLSLNASILFFTRQKGTASSNRGQSSRSSFRARSRSDVCVLVPCCRGVACLRLYVILTAILGVLAARISRDLRRMLQSLDLTTLV